MWACNREWFILYFQSETARTNLFLGYFAHIAWREQDGIIAKDFYWSKVGEKSYIRYISGRVLKSCFFFPQIQENVKTLTQDRDNIQLLYEQATDEIQRLRRQVSQARSPSPSRAASAVLARVEAERDSALADVRRINLQLNNLEDKLEVCADKC